MESKFIYEERKDTMSHECGILEMDVTINRYDFAGIVDRRFKSGYRIKPQSGVNTMINYINAERNDRFKMRQIWQIGKPKTSSDLGKYMVVSLLPDYIKLIPVSLNQNLDRKSFLFTNKIDFIYYGSPVGEAD